MKYKTSELNGAMLDAAVVNALGATAVRYGNGVYVNGSAFHPSTNWDHGGPIIERERIGTTWPEESPPAGYEWHANLARPEASFNAYGPTPLIAAMRAYVAHKLGDEVEL